MVRALLRQHPRLQLQHRSDNIHHAARCHRGVGYLREFQRQQRLEGQPLVRALRWPARYSVLRIRMVGSGNRSRGAYNIVSRPEIQERRQIPHHRPYEEHHAALHADADDRIFHIRRNRDPFYRQSADGPELSGGYLHSGQLSQPRPVWRPSAVLRTGIHLTGEIRRRRTVLHSFEDHRRTGVPAQGESKQGRERLILHSEHQRQV